MKRLLTPAAALLMLLATPIPAAARTGAPAANGAGTPLAAAAPSAAALPPTTAAASPAAALTPAPAASAAPLPTARIACGPYLQDVTDEGFTVVWTTTTDAAAWVEVAPDDGTHFYAAERPKYFDTHLGRRRTGCLHRVRVEGLQPAAAYRYRVLQQAVVCDEGNRRVILGNGTGSDVFRRKPLPVRTLDPAQERVAFWMVNDIHGRDSLFRRLIADAPRERPDFVCLNGDMVSSVESDRTLRDGFLRTAGEVLAPAGIPLVAVRGNHENRGAYALRWSDYFPTPTGRTYYTFRRGPALFVVLDGVEDKPDSDVQYFGLMAADAYREEQARWLAEVVRSEEFRTAPVRIVLIHMVPGDAASWHGEQEIRRLFVPLLNGQGVDLMLCGHYHKYRWIDDGSRGTDYPILVNSNTDRAEITADAAGIDIRIVDAAGGTLHRHRIDKRTSAER